MFPLFRQHLTYSARGLDVVIVGGGIGGMSTAIAMRRAGHRVYILEAATEQLEFGAGLNVSICFIPPLGQKQSFQMYLHMKF